MADAKLGGDLMEKRTIRIYKQCEDCKGTGLITEHDRIFDCRTCQGYGETLEKVYKDVNINELELPTRS